MTSPASPESAGQNSTTPVSSFKRGLFSRLSRRSIQQTNAGVQKTNGQQPTDGSTRPSSNLCSFQSLWRDALAVMNEPAEVPERRTSTTVDSCETVIKLTSQMVGILTKRGDATSGTESSGNDFDSRILDYFYSEDVLVKLLDWAERRRPEFEPRLKLHLLGSFNSILGLGSCQFFMDRQILRPLFRLIASCLEVKDAKVFEERLAVVFHRLCFGISQYSEVLEALFSEACMNSDAGGHSLISSLTPYVHWDGPVGQQARDALQVIICLSSAHKEVSEYIVSRSNFCPVLAAGLTGLYSSLPRKLSYSSDDWSGISEEDIRSSLDLQRFLTSLTFCNDIIKVSPPSIRQHLLEFIYNGFLVPVIAPGLHQGASGVDEVIATTAYLNLFLTRITEPYLLSIFLRFILLVKVDELSILELLVQRIAHPQTKLCVVTLVLFKSLVELNCEDVMYHLVFRYLMPCTHVMVSQQRSIADVDLYCRNAEKLLSLIPECCSIDTTRSQASPRNSMGDISSTTVPPVDLLESSYVEYLHTARVCLDRCRRACRSWTLTYDGRNATSLSTDGRRSPVENPSRRIPASYGDEQLSDGVVPARNTEDAAGKIAGGGSGVEPVVSTTSVRINELHCGDNGSQGFNATTENSAQGTSGPGDGVWATSGQNGLGAFRELKRTPSCGLLSGASLSVEDLDSFLVQLSRVQMPEESESGLEELLGELDSLLAESRRVPSSASTSSVVTNAKTGFSEAAPVSSEPHHVAGTLPQVVVAPSSDSSANGGQTETLNVVSSGSMQTSLDPVKVGIQGVDDQSVIPRPVNLGLPISDYGRGQTSLGSLSSARNSALSPTVGPFLTTLLQKVEAMKQNTFYVNLHLTGLLARLACYPQPLLQSILLSQTLVFQPSVKSLAQVLNFVKCRLDEFFLTVSEKDMMMIQAQHYLRYRDGQMRNDARMSLGDVRMSSPAAKAVPPKQARLTLLGNRHGARYTPQSPTVGQASMAQDSPEFVEKKNAVYCALILKEFLKELAAISQEHTVLQMQSS